MRWSSDRAARRVHERGFCGAQAAGRDRRVVVVTVAPGDRPEAAGHDVQAVARRARTPDLTRTFSQDLESSRFGSTASSVYHPGDSLFVPEDTTHVDTLLLPVSAPWLKPGIRGH